MRILRRWWWALVLLIILLVVAGGWVWANDALGPMPQALAALSSDEQVVFEQEGSWLTFRPRDGTPETGFIFYPGGRVDYRSYAPFARDIAAAGYLVVVPQMPLNLAVLDPDAAAGVIAAYPAVEGWAIGGHSLGGAMAARYVFENAQAMDGLALWAAYPAGGNSLAASPAAVVSIYGTVDGVATPQDIDASAPLLPEQTAWTAIEGGNHAQFGWYGDQAGDNPAAISRPEQQRQTVEATVNMLAGIGGG